MEKEKKSRQFPRNNLCTCHQSKPKQIRQKNQLFYFWVTPTTLVYLPRHYFNLPKCWLNFILFFLIIVFSSWNIYFYNTLLLLFASGFAFCSSSMVFPSAAARCASNDQQPEAFCRETNCSNGSWGGWSNQHASEKKIRRLRFQ